MFRKALVAIVAVMLVPCGVGYADTLNNTNSQAVNVRSSAGGTTAVSAVAMAGDTAAGALAFAGTTAACAIDNALSIANSATRNAMNRRSYYGPGDYAGQMNSVPKVDVSVPGVNVHTGGGGCSVPNVNINAGGAGVCVGTPEYERK